ncbi:MAG: CRISPR-associated helicase Cas3', partial [bacterium]
WRESQKDIFSYIKKYWNIQEFPEVPEHIAIFISGLITTCDWISSNEYLFPYKNQKVNIEDSRDKAKSAIKKCGLEKQYSDYSLDFNSLFDIKSCRPLQDSVIDISEEDNDFVIIEAPTGEGKTEAALYLHYCMEKNKFSHGMYYALPTKATSDQMFERIYRFIKNQNGDFKSELHLINGNSFLNKLYGKIKFDTLNDKNSKIIANNWFCNSKKAILIAQNGVGTIDQLLMSSVWVEFFFLRLFGLSGKTVILDEVHAYDTYMTNLINVFLSWCRPLGIRVIILSATLPSIKRKEFYKNFYGKDLLFEEQKYPRITTKDKSITFDYRESKDINIKLLEETEDGIKLLLEKISNGGCGVYIANTVNRSQGIYNIIKETGIECYLLHSRYMTKDRERIEEIIKSKFGKDGNRPKQAILISTQIVEQSMDLDFDFMVTDLAPIDLIYQRAGRLHRHIRPRPDKCEQPCLGIVKNIDSYMYFEYILKRTLEHLINKKVINSASSVEDSVEFVYGNYNLLNEELKKNLDDMKCKEILDENKAISNTIGIFNKNSVFASCTLFSKDRDDYPVVRLCEKTIRCIVLFKKDDSLYLDSNFKIIYNNKTSEIELLKNSVSLNGRILSEDENPYEDIKFNTSHLKYFNALVLENDFSLWNDKKIFYDKEIGLFIEREKE